MVLCTIAPPPQLVIRWGFLNQPKGDRRLDERNPYEAPLTDVRSPLLLGHGDRRAGSRTYVGWIVVFALNLDLPLRFSIPVTEAHGRLGMSIAALLLLALGCRFICGVGRNVAHAFIVGGGVVATTQLIPFLQVFAWFRGMRAG
jgi:hypothetical protein